MSLRSVASAARLAQGGIRRVARAGRTAPTPALISIDVFGTLLQRRLDENAAWRAGAYRVVQVARAAGGAPPSDPQAFRRRVEAKLAREAVREGRDPEFSHAAVLEMMLADAGIAKAAPLAEALAAWELRQEMEFTAPVPEIVDWVAQQAGLGRRVIAVSDTRYGGESLSALLEHHGVHGLSAVYASADHAASKFSGRLFDCVCAAESVAPDKVWHAGDSMTADILSASQRGLWVRRIRPPAAPAAAAPLPAAPSPEPSGSQQFLVGYRVIGPILTAFCRLVLAQAQADGVDHLAFVARDGDLPLRICRLLLEGSSDAEPLRLSYLHLSRRAAKGALEEGGPAVERLRRHLEQSGVFNLQTALVDVGWAGSTHKLIAAAGQGKPLPRAYYLGFYNEAGPLDPDPRVVGLLCDQRRGCGPLEVAAWHAAFLIEAVCRAQHGTVIGFEDSQDGTVTPIHATTGDARAGELISETAQGEIRAGVLAYARWLAHVCGRAPPDPLRVRRAAQRRLFALAIIPRPEECDVGHDLVHTEAEGTAGAKSLAPPLGGGLKGWTAGIRSPWKGAFFRENGGFVVAALYCLAELTLGVLPPGTKLKLRTLIFRTGAEVPESRPEMVSKLGGRPEA